MERVSRRRKVICALSVVASLLVIVLWVHSYRRHEVLLYGTHRHCATIGATHGRFSLRHMRLESNDSGVHFGDPGFKHNSARAQPMQPGLYASDCRIFWAIGPFSFIVGSERAGDWQRPGGAHWDMHLQELIVPHWFVLMLTVCPAVLLVYRHAKRPREGHCAKCGYDLRASPQRCPECGAATAAGVPV